MTEPLTREHFIAVGLILGMSEDEAALMVELFQDGPEFCLTYADASRLLRVPEATLRGRVMRRIYREGLDYERLGPRTVRFSLRILRNSGKE